LRTGDWSLQTKEKVQQRLYTHPLFKEVARVKSPPTAEASPNTASRPALWLRLGLPLMVFLAIGALLWLWMLPSPSKNGLKAQAPDKAGAKAPVAPRPKTEAETTDHATREVRVLSEPAGATLFDAQNGQELGQTPLTIKMVRGVPRKIQIRLPGYEMQSVELSSETETRTLILTREAPSP
jgi:hypothetical protein